MGNGVFCCFMLKSYQRDDFSASFLLCRQSRSQISWTFKKEHWRYLSIVSADSGIHSKHSQPSGHFEYLVLKFEKCDNYLGPWFLVQE